MGTIKRIDSATLCYAYACRHGHYLYCKYVFVQLRNKLNSFLVNHASCYNEFPVKINHSKHVYLHSCVCVCVQIGRKATKIILACVSKLNCLTMILEIDHAGAHQYLP